MKLGKAIKLINPSAEYSYNNEDYDSIEWLNGTTPISKADIEAKYTEIEAIDNRLNEYAQIKDQLDLLYHDMVANKLDTTGEWHKSIKAIKDKYPKE